LNKIDITKLRKLIDDFGRLPKLQQKRKTFFDVAGYRHYENVCSNILAFFFDTSEQHNMLDLFLRSLLSLIPKNTRLSTNAIEAEITTEYYTNKGTYIDIKIESNDFIIILENKIDADVYNDLDSYIADIRENNPYSKQIVAVVLTLKDMLRKEDNIKIESSGFNHVTYTDFFNVIKENLGDYIEKADVEWVVYLRNFLRNMSNLKGDEIMQSVDYKDVINFLIENDDSIYELIEQREAFTKHFQIEGEAVRNILRDEYSLEFNIWKGGIKFCGTSVYSEFSDKSKPNFEIHRILRGWEILLKTSSKHKKTDIVKWLNKNDIPCANNSIVQWKWTPVSLWVHKIEDNKPITPDEIAEIAYNYYQKIDAASSM